MNNTNTSSSSRRATVVSATFNFLAGAMQLGMVLVAVVALLASSAAAQLSGTGAISGIITDPSGAVVSGATVTATNVNTNVKTVRTTTGAGDYNITPLTPGSYTVSVTAKGFQQLTQENVTVDALATVNLPLKLTVGRADETVTVSAAPPILATTDATLGAVMDNQMYSNLPIEMGAGTKADQRRATDFAYLMPGVQANQNGASNDPTSTTGIVNGSGPGGNVSEIYIEGINLPEADGVGDPRFTWTAIGVDAVDQFQVQTAGISAQYGGQGMQNYSVKSGSNAYHGSIYEFNRNTIFDAWQFQSKAPTINSAGVTVPGGIKTSEVMNEVGIVLSGPVIKNRLFLFGNYGQYRYQQGAKPAAMTIPTSSMLGYDANGNALGYADFRGYAAANGGAHIYDPSTSVVNCLGTVASPCSRKPFMGSVNGVPTADVIPASRFSAAANNYNKYMLPYEKLANQTLYNNNLTYGTPIGLANWYATGRIDYTVNQRNQIGVIVAFGRQASTGPNSTSGLGPPFNTSQSYHPVTTIDIVKDTFTINAHLVNQFAVGYGRYQSDSVTPNRTPAYSATANGILNMPAGQASDGFPKISYSGNYDAPGTQGGYSWNNKINNTYTLTDSLQWVVGRHNVTVGGQIVDVQFNYYSTVSPSGPMGFTFSSSQTAQFTNPTTSTSLSTTNGSPFASYLLGASSAGSATVGVPGLGTRWLDPSFWGQDDFKVTSKLTLNLGLRWDIYPSIREAHNYFTFLNPNGVNNITGNKGTLEFAGNGDPSIYCNCQRPSPIWYKNIAPRIGMAWSIDPKTVVRGSYNVNFARGNWTSGSQSGSPSTLGISPSASAPSGLSGAPAFYWDNTNCASGSFNGVACGWTGSVVPPKPPTGGASLAEYGTTYTSALTNSGATTITSWDPYRGSRTPEYINWTFGIQRQLTSQMSISVSYVGSQGHFLSVKGASLKLNNKLPYSFAALAGYQLNGSTTTPCSGTACTAPLLTQKSSATNVGLATGLGYVIQNPYSSATYYASNSVYQNFVPFPQYSGVSDTTSFAGNTNYHALQLSLRQRTSHGLDFMLNYTYSKAMDDIPNSSNGFRLPEQPRLDRSLSTSDQPQTLTSTAVYQLPFGHGKIGGDNFWANALGGGWNLSGIFSYHSGVPLYLDGATGCGGSSILGNCMPSIVPGQTVRNSTPYGHNATSSSSDPNYYAKIQYLNVNAFTVATSTANSASTPQNNFVGLGPQLYVPGNAPRVGAGNVWSMGDYNLDLGVKRSFPIYHEWKLQFECDALNALNHVAFGALGGAVNATGYGLTSALATGYQARSFQFSGRINW